LSARARRRCRRLLGRGRVPRSGRSFLAPYARPLPKPEPGAGGAALPRSQSRQSVVAAAGRLAGRRRWLRSERSESAAGWGASAASLETKAGTAITRTDG